MNFQVDGASENAPHLFYSQLIENNINGLTVPARITPHLGPQQATSRRSRNQPENSDSSRSQQQAPQPPRQQ